MRLSTPYVLRGFALGIGIGLLLLSVPTAYGQTTIPNTNAIESIADTAENLGALGFAVVCLGIALVVLIIGILVFFWKAISPLLTAITASTKSRDEAAAAERQAREEQQLASNTSMKVLQDSDRATQELRTRQTEAMERIVDKLNQNDMRSEEGRKEAVTAINAHTDVKVDELRDEIAIVKKELETAVSKEDIEPIIGKLDEIMTRLPQTDKLPPLSSLTDADPSAPSTPPAAAPEPPTP